MHPKHLLSLVLSIAVFHGLECSGAVAEAKSSSTHPNVVVVIADDQGYGDLGHTGNPVIRTPNIDALAAESSSLTDYHVAPTCSPTRAALMTGHWTNRTGVWHTINGRSMLRANEVTLGAMFASRGYRTGMFGKWHLGDNYPYRPEDRGFTEVYRHGGGGVGQTPDVWDNSYFDGAYFHNGKIEQATGFCTDVFFSKAHDFIRASAESGEPFLAYISTNAPHGPLHCPEKYLAMYSDQNKRLAAFLGMITNIDDNVGATRELLDDLGIDQNTIFVFTTDNGTATGDKLFNAAMRGKKGSPYEGGHRVPFIMHWPAGGMNVEHSSSQLCHAVDVAPTLLDLCKLPQPDGVKFDGVSVAELLDPKQAEDNPAWDQRMLVTDSQRVRDPIKWRQSSVMQSKWRLINGEQLFELTSDPSQASDVSAMFPERVASMRSFYENWWTELEPTFAETTEIVIGHPEHPEVSMTAHDWIQDALPPWNQGHIRGGGAGNSKRKNRKPADFDGHWAIEVVTAGTYEIELRRWPKESGVAINAGLPAGEQVPGADLAFRARDGFAFDFDRAELLIDDQSVAESKVESGAEFVRFTADLKTGSHQLSPRLIQGDQIVGAFYCIVRKQD